jgi:outer membrane receptor for ferrienterochelin and colicins
MLRRFLYILSLHSPRRLLSAHIRIGTRCPVMMIITLLYVLLPTARAAVITGSVRNASTGKGVEGATITLNIPGLGCEADRFGRYMLPAVPGGSWDVTAARIGYLPESKRIRPAEDDTVTLDFSLHEQAIALQEVVFTATRTLKTLKNVPVATELISRADFQRRGATNVAEALETEIGYEVQEDFSGQGVSLQGVDPDKVLILVDGNRVIGRVNGSIDLEQLSVSNVKQIEVVKGSASTLYGSEAIGGVINIISDQPAEGFDVRFDAVIGGYFPNSDSFRKGSLSYSPSLNLSGSSGSFSYAIGLRPTHIGLIDITPETEHTTGTPETDRLNGDLKLILHQTPTLDYILTTRAMREKKGWMEDAGLTSIQLSYDDSETNESFDLALESVYQPKKDERLSLKVYRTVNNHDWEKQTQPKWGPVMVKDYSRGDETYLEFSALYTFPYGSSHLFTVGGDRYQWDISSDSKMGEITSPFSGNLTAGSAFVQDEWHISPRWTLLPGLRYENHEVYGGNVAPRLSLMISARDDLRIRASLGAGYRAPSSKELYYIFNHSAAGYVVYGNTELKPEKSLNFSISVDHNYQNRSLARITLFQNNMRNLIDFYQTGISEEFYLGIYQYKNIYSAWVRGVELERGFKPLTGIEIKAAYAFMETHNGLTGGSLLRRPKHSARWDVTYRSGEWTGKVWGRFTSKSMFTDIFETDEQVSDEWTIPYEVWNISVSRDWGKDWSVFMKIENLLDRTHGRYGPYEGRTISLGGNRTLKR